MEDALLEIVDICKSNQIKKIGIKFPLTNEYYAVTSDKSFGVDSIFRVNNLKVLDFQSKYIDKSNLFLDADYLNLEGGKLFADVLFKEKQSKIND